MAAITKEQIKRVYALGAAVGIVERGNKDDTLHAMVFTLTGKASISELTGKEFLAVERELLSRLRLVNRISPLKRRPKKAEVETQPGMMSHAQQSLAWRLIYRLMELDSQSGTASAGDRMCGAIKKVLQVEVQAKNPFAWVTAQQGHTLIEHLKRYVRSAESKARKAGAG